MNDIMMDDREKLILQAVVHAYITTAEPVGSRTVVKRFNLDISPATVRNVMADLEENGYISQRHTSSGRIPTDKGYRYYVDYLMQVQEVTQSERVQLEREFMTKLNDADEVLSQTSQLLALMSQQTSIVEGPDTSEARINRVELIPMGECRLVVLLADNYGRVETSVMTLEDQLSNDELVRIGRFLNDHLQGVALDKAGATLNTRLAAVIDEERALAEQAIHIMNLAPSRTQSQLYLQGATQLFEQPEFSDVKKAREVFGLLEERDLVMELLRAGIASASGRDSRVLIGSESAKEGAEEISLVSAPYKIQGKSVGMLGVLGPRRMPYSRLTGVVEYTAGMLSRILTRMAG